MSKTDLDEIRKETAKTLLEISAVFLSPKEPFTWTSGIKSPIYCDSRMILSSVRHRGFIIRQLTDLIYRKYPQTQAILGIATAGIAHATLIAHELNLPLGYIRSKPKSHGRTNQIEGRFAPGEKIIVIEDLLSTGGTSIKASLAAKQAGLNVQAIVSIFSYDLPLMKKNMRENDFNHHSLCTLDDLLDYAQKEGLIEEAEVELVRQFRNDENNW